MTLIPVFPLLSSVQLNFSLDPSSALPPCLYFTRGSIKTFSVTECAHVLMKGHTHNRALQVQILPAYKLTLFSHGAKECFRYLHRPLGDSLSVP